MAKTCITAVEGIDGGRVTITKFQIGTAKDSADRELDCVTFFDCLHDVDPPGSATQAGEAKLREVIAASA